MVMRVWHGTALDGYGLLVERDVVGCSTPPATVRFRQSRVRGLAPPARCRSRGPGACWARPSPQPRQMSERHSGDFGMRRRRSVFALGREEAAWIALAATPRPAVARCGSRRGRRPRGRGVRIRLSPRRGATLPLRSPPRHLPRPDVSRGHPAAQARLRSRRGSPSPPRSALEPQPALPGIMSGLNRDGLKGSGPIGGRSVAHRLITEQVSVRWQWRGCCRSGAEAPR